MLVDNDVSAYSGRRRPEYERLIAGIEDRTFDAVVTWHPDRLHRSPRELEDFIAVIERAGAAIGSVTAGNWDLSTPDGRLAARVVGAVARKESEDKSRRLRRKHLELAQNGEVAGGGPRPFGFEPDRVTVRESEAAEIRDAVRRVIAGESVRSVRVDWQQRVPSVTGAAWTHVGVRRILTSARIAGRREHGGLTYDAVWPAIVEPEELARVRARFAAPSNGRAARVNLLVGMVYCGRCSKRMGTSVSTRGDRVYRRYHCVADGGGCGNSVTVIGVDKMVRNGIIVAAGSERRRKRSLLSPVVDLSEFDRQEVELGEMYAAGEITRAVLAAAQARLNERRAQAQAASVEESTAHAAGEWVGRADEIAAGWDGWSLGVRRSVAEAFVERITVDPVATIGRFDPNRVHIEWR